MLLCLGVHMKLVWDVPRAMLMLMAGQGGLYWRGTMCGVSLGQATGSCRHSLRHKGSLTTSVLSLQRSAGSSSPEAGEGKVNSLEHSTALEPNQNAP